MSVIRNILNSTKLLVNNSLPTTGSNTFRGTQTFSGSLIPATDNTYDLGSSTNQFRDLYLSSASLYIDGTKVLGSTAQELTITTDEGQSIKILEAGSDSIILQSADGDIELKSSGGGDILLDPTTGLISVKGTLQIQDGNKITSSGGNSVVVGNNIVISGSLESVGTINGINLSSFSSSVASTFLNQNTATSSYETKGSGIISGSSQVVLSSTNGFSAFSSSIDSRIVTEKGRVDAILTAVDADKDSFAEIVTLINSVDTTNDTAFASFATSSNATNTTQNSRLTALESTTGSYETQGRGIVSGSSQVISILSSLNTYTGSNDTTNTAQNSRLTSIESATGSYETRGRGIVSGSSQITLSSTTGYGSVLNQAVLTTSSPTFAGITISGKVTATSAGVDGTFADAFVSQYSSNNSEQNAIQTSVSSVAVSSGFRFQVSNGGGSSSRTNVVDFKRDRAIFNTFVGIGTSDPARGLHISGTSAGAELTITETAMAVGSKNFNIVGSSANGTWSLRTLTDNSLAQSVNFVSFTAGTGTATFSGNVLPDGNGTRDLGSSAARWSTIYTSDLSLNNGIGDWTIVEGEDDLFLYNNKKGKVYKFALTEVDPSVATPKKS